MQQLTQRVQLGDHFVAVLADQFPICKQPQARQAADAALLRDRRVPRANVDDTQTNVIATVCLSLQLRLHWATSGSKVCRKADDRQAASRNDRRDVQGFTVRDRSDGCRARNTTRASRNGTALLLLHDDKTDEAQQGTGDQSKQNAHAAASSGCMHRLDCSAHNGTRSATHPWHGSVLGDAAYNTQRGAAAAAVSRAATSRTFKASTTNSVRPVNAATAKAANPK